MLVLVKKAPMTYNLEMEVKELQAKISDPTAPKTIKIVFYAIDGDSNNIDLSFFIKNNIWYQKAHDKLSSIYCISTLRNNF